MEENARGDSPSDERSHQEHREEAGREPVRREPGTPTLADRDPRLSPHLEVMRTMIRDFNRMFEGWPQLPAFRPGGMQAWPRIEALEQGGTLIVRAELPGLDRDDIRVRVQEDTLIIEGERRSDAETRQEGYYESEWSYGRFARRIPLPAGADADRVEARFRNGILEVAFGLLRPTAREIPIQG